MCFFLPEWILEQNDVMKCIWTPSVYLERVEIVMLPFFLLYIKEIIVIFACNIIVLIFCFLYTISGKDRWTQRWHIMH